jgi:hypothetical protein
MMDHNGSIPIHHYKPVIQSVASRGDKADASKSSAVLYYSIRQNCKSYFTVNLPWALKNLETPLSDILSVCRILGYSPDSGVDKNVSVV